MLSISEFSSLNFRTDWKGRTNIDVDYRQRFLPSDEIRVQFSCDVESYPQASVTLYSHTSGNQTVLSPVSIGADEDSQTGQVVLPTLDTGKYDLTIQIGSETQTSTFCIVDSFEDSILVKCTNYRTEFGAIFTDPFFFRVEGIILPSDVNFEVSTEDFRDQRYNATMLSAFPYEKLALTVGLGQGVPNWVGRKLNFIFSCSDVYIDGVRVVRSEGSAPQKTILQQDNPLFVWKIDIEPQGEVVEEKYFQASPASLTFHAIPTESKQLRIYTNYGIISVTSPDSWIQITPIAGSLNYLLVGASANSSDDSRSGVIEVNTSGGIFTVPVAQTGAAEAFFEATPNPMTFLTSGGTQTLSILTNLEIIRVSVTGMVMDVVKVSQGTLGSSYDVTVNSNTETTTISGSIVFETSGGIYEVGVYQNGADADHFYVTPDGMTYTSIAGTVRLVVHTSYTIYSHRVYDESWASVVKVDDYNYDFTRLKNEGTSGRHNYIFFETSGGEFSHHVYQAGADKPTNYFNISPNPLVFEWSAGTETAIANTDYEILSVTPSAEWLEVKNIVAEPGLYANIHLAATANLGDNNRSATVEIVTSGGVFTLDVLQHNNLEGYIYTDPSAIDNLEINGRQIIVYSNRGLVDHWECVDNNGNPVTWLSVIRHSEGSNSFGVHPELNTTGQARSAIIWFWTTGGLSVSVPVTQPVSQGMTHSPSPVIFPKEGGDMYVIITSTVELDRWQSVGGDNVLKYYGMVDDYGETDGIWSYRFLLQAYPNTDTTRKMEALHFTSRYDILSMTIDVQQEANIDMYMVPEVIEFSPAADSYIATLYQNTGHAVSPEYTQPDADWARITGIESNVAFPRVTIEVDPNTGGERTTSYTVSIPGKTVIGYITQMAALPYVPLTATPSSITVDSAAQSVTIDVNCSKPWYVGYYASWFTSIVPMPTLDNPITGSATITVFLPQNTSGVYFQGNIEFYTVDPNDDEEDGSWARVSIRQNG